MEYCEEILAECRKHREQAYTDWRKAKNFYEETRRASESKSKTPGPNVTFEENGIFYQNLTAFPNWAQQFCPDREKPEELYLRIRYILIEGQMTADFDSLIGWVLTIFFSIKKFEFQIMLLKLIQVSFEDLAKPCQMLASLRNIM